MDAFFARACVLLLARDDAKAGWRLWMHVLPALLLARDDAKHEHDEDDDDSDLRTPNQFSQDCDDDDDDHHALLMMMVTMMFEHKIDDPTTVMMMVMMLMSRMECSQCQKLKSEFDEHDDGHNGLRQLSWQSMMFQGDDHKGKNQTKNLMMLMMMTMIFQS